MTRLRSAGPALLLTAAAAGMVHGGFSLLWAAGGDALLDTVGERMTSAFEGRRLLLAPIGLVKVGFALLPLVLLTRHPVMARLVRPVCWIGAVLLSVWGGLGAVTGHLVLAGIIEPSGGFDHAAMMGHAWLWDPLFLVWGVSLALGLWALRREHTPADRVTDRPAGDHRVTRHTRQDAGADPASGARNVAR